MNTNIHQRLQRLEHARRTRGGCRCANNARFVSPTTTIPRCPHCRKPILVIVVTDLPAGSSVPIPHALQQPLRHATTNGGRVELSQLSDTELDELATALRAAAS